MEASDGRSVGIESEESCCQNNRSANQDLDGEETRGEGESL